MLNKIVGFERHLVRNRRTTGHDLTGFQIAADPRTRRDHDPIPDLKVIRNSSLPSHYD